MTLDEYLSNYSKRRRIDGVIKKWFTSKYGVEYIKQTKKNWDKTIEEFYSETLS